LSKDLLTKYTFHQHNCHDDENIVCLGITTRNTNVLFNKNFFNCDLKISIGNIEPHHFAGFSGGYKTVAIGLAGKQTINENHKLLMNPKSVAGVYDGNPVRMDINEIGMMTGLHYCLNCIMNEDKDIISIIFDKPDRVMEIGIPIVKSIYMVEVQKKYDYVIASAGGFPKDINFYQAQKALTNAAQICCDGGTIILLAECREGIGSDIFEDYMKTFSNPIDIISDFVKSPFQVGRHKAYLVARLLSNHHIALHSSLDEGKTNRLLLEKISEPMIYLDNLLTPESSIAFIPNAVVTVPNSQGKSDEKPSSK
jgi:nickel-dependent lactate racemase